MNIKDFFICSQFECGKKLWRCTDIGSRVIVAICLSDHIEDSSWFNGPPYAVSEEVFDEDSMCDCEPVNVRYHRKQAELPTNVFRSEDLE